MRRPLAAACVALVMGCRLEFDPSLLEEGAATCAGIADGAACAGTAGTCYAGACCTGCWDGTACLDGTRALACGSEGSACQTCSAPMDVCAAGHCAVERRVSAVSMGVGHTVFIDALGALWTFGDNSAGALGRSDDATIGRVGGDGQWASASASCCGVGGFTLAANTDHARLSCGSNDDGQLGDGTQTSRDTLAIADAYGWTSLAGGDAFGCGVQVDGTLWCWGWNGYHALAQGDSVDHSPSPLRVNADTDWSSVSARFDLACALKRDATLWCWGSGATGRTSTAILAPVEPATNWREVAIGRNHACGIRLDGSLYCWGDNTYAQLGLPGVTASQLPAQVGQAKRWKHVSAGDAFSCGTQTDGSLWCWGTGVSGELGMGAAGPDPVPSPSRVGTRNDWELVSAALRSACAVSYDGLLWCWGQGSEIPFGNVQKHEPTLVLFAP